MMKSTNWIHKITRSELVDEPLYGFILKKSDDLMLIAEEDHFILDGYKVVRNADIVECKPTPATRYSTRLMKKEGFRLDDSINSSINISDWRNLFIDLKKMGEFVIIEDELDDHFLIGPILRVNKKSVRIHYFDGTGKWLEPENIAFEDVTSVGFGSRYIRIHQKYIKERS